MFTLSTINSCTKSSLTKHYQIIIRKVVAKNGRTIQNIMLQLIIEGQAKGEIANDDPEPLLAAIMACINGLVKRAELLERDGLRKHFPDAKIFLRMLRARS